MRRQNLSLQSTFPIKLYQPDEDPTVGQGCSMLRSSRPEVFCDKDVLRNFAKFTGKHLYRGLQLVKKETLAQVFSCEFCEISKNTFS